jgi:hypothetical protein
MRGKTVLFSLALTVLTALGLINSSYAQVPHAIKDKLTSGGVVLHEGNYYATVTGTLRGTREAMESMLSTKAMRAISYKLCALEPVAGRRLETKITGFSMTSSELAGTELSVTMSAPAQTPSCQLIVLPPPPPVPVPFPLPAPIPTPPSNTSVLPATPGSSDITIRNFGNEY